jgi:hypothetical protein
MRADRLQRPLAGLVLLPLLLGGCVLGPGTLDGATPVNMHVWTTPTTVEIDAPGWTVDVSAVYLCATAPPRLPDASTDRIAWTPGGDCHDFGTHPSRDGLTVSLPLADLAGTAWPAFEASDEWYVLLLDLDGDLVSSAVRSQFHAPRDIVAS